MNSDKVLTTADEVRFFKNVKPKEGSKLQFLINYKEALCTRTNWDNINKKKLYQELNKEIKNERS